MALSIPGPAGSLSAELWLPGEQPTAPRAVCALSHPHPLHGGTMRNTVVHRIGRGLQAAGLAVLRFDFRGVGASTGAFDGRVGAGGEEDDLAAALDWLGERFPSAELWAGGFSFGARVAAGLALRDERIRRLLLVALPVRTFDPAYLRELDKPGLLVAGGQDAFGTLSDLRRAVPKLARTMQGLELPDADHFFRELTHDLQALVRDWAERELSRTR